MLETVSLKSLALKVLREAGDGEASEKTCSTGIISKEASGTEQEVEQNAEQALTVSARVWGQETIAESTRADVCFHCHGEKFCQCALCAVPGPSPLAWQKGECRACKGTRFLCWPERLQ